jgi:RNA polymerase sigma-70 factor (ECF subfamily)
LTVVARRIVVHELLKRKNLATLVEPAESAGGAHRENGNRAAVERVENRDEIERLLGELDGTEAEIVRLYHLEGKSYQEISGAVGMPENSIGPTLSRARQKMRRVGAE